MGQWVEATYGPPYNPAVKYRPDCRC